MPVTESPIFGRSQFMFPGMPTMLTGKSFVEPTAPTVRVTASGSEYSPIPSWVQRSEGTTFQGTLTTAGLLTSAFGAVNTAIGSYFAAESQKNALKMQAQNQKFAAQMAAINARASEFSAQTAMLAGQQAIARYTMGAGQARASAVAEMAGRGIQGGVGSAKEVLASMDLVSKIDQLTMNSNIVRQAEAYRMQAVNYATQSEMANLSSQNLLSSAGSISPGMQAYGSLLGSAADISQSWLRTKRFEELLGGVSTKRI
jgi:hypothetical protein